MSLWLAIPSVCGMKRGSGTIGSRSIMAGDLPVDMSNIYLTDDFDRPDRFQFPVMSLVNGGFSLVWADDDPEQGELHAPFKLDRMGEEIALFEKIGEDFFLLDRIGFDEQISNISYGRQRDGDPDWITFTQPTPGFSNNPGEPPPHRTDILAQSQFDRRSLLLRNPRYLGV